MAQPTAIVIGAGIVGLATARALSLKGYAVKVFDRSEKAVGASVRNFGMVWPVGQPSGKLYEHALCSRSIWKEIGESGVFWFNPSGSLHVAYHADEWQVLQELYETYKDERRVKLLSPVEIAERSDATVQNGLLGGLYSPNEMVIDPREAIGALPAYLAEKFNVEFFWNKCISYVADNTVYIGNEEECEADIIFVCSGADFETLYPEFYSGLPITKCKLQMMRFATQPNNWNIGPSLCGGLSLMHYKSFAVAPSLPQLKKRYTQELGEYIDWGIHVMVSQNGNGELTVGDSHEYGLTPDPFDRAHINTLIIDYLKTFAQFKDWTIAQTWNGTYAKFTTEGNELFFSPEPGVYIINGVGGAGMTLSFGLAESLLSAI